MAPGRDSQKRGGHLRRSRPVLLTSRRGTSSRSSQRSATRGLQGSRAVARPPRVDVTDRGLAAGEYEVPAPVEPDTCIDASAALMPTPGEMPAFVPNQSLRLLDLRG